MNNVVAVDEFTRYCMLTLEVYFGQMSDEIITKIKARKSLNQNSTPDDIKQFIDLIESSISLFSGKNKATEICNILRTKASEMIGAMNARDTAMSNIIDKEINAFLSSNSLPAEVDITDYAKYLALKFGSSANSVEKDLIDKVKAHVRRGISTKMLKEEINKFLTKYSQPGKTDVDDFVHYISLLKLDLKESEVRELVENERLYRKFHGPEEATDSSELGQFINLVKTSSDKESIGKLMQKQGLSYLIKDDKGLSDKSLSEFVELMTPNERDMKDALEGMGLKHLIKSK